MARSPSLALLKTLAGEGKYHLYRLLTNGKRIFLFLKCAKVVTFHTFRSGKPNYASRVTFIKGANQLRLCRRQYNELKEEFGSLHVCAMSSLKYFPNQSYLPKFSLKDASIQYYYLLYMLILGKKRYLNLFLLSFYNSINKSLNYGLPCIQEALFFNDQPFEMAAIAYSLNSRDDVRTVTKQHGLILSENFYFPTNSKEFHAWGNLSRRHFSSRVSTGKLIIRGRSKTDGLRKRADFVLPEGGMRNLRILGATSFLMSDIASLIRALREEFPAHSAQPVIGIKLHPATKAAWLVRRRIRRALPNAAIEMSDMEDLASEYDILVTKNSSSAIDFMLLGKPVIFLSPPAKAKFPSVQYGFDLEDIRNFINNRKIEIGKNKKRLQFLKESLNV